MNSRIIFMGEGWSGCIPCSNNTVKLIYVSILTIIYPQPIDTNIPRYIVAGEGGGEDMGEASPPNFLASLLKTLTLIIKFSIKIYQIKSLALNFFDQKLPEKIWRN